MAPFGAKTNNLKFISLVLQNHVSTALNSYSVFILGWTPFKHKYTYQASIRSKLPLLTLLWSKNRQKNNQDTFDIYYGKLCLLFVWIVDLNSYSVFILGWTPFKHKYTYQASIRSKLPLLTLLWSKNRQKNNQDTFDIYYGKLCLLFVWIVDQVVFM